MGQLHLNLAESSRHAAPPETVASLHAVPRVAAMGSVQGSRAFRGLFFASLMAAAFWTGVAVLILQMR